MIPAMIAAAARRRVMVFSLVLFGLVGEVDFVRADDDHGDTARLLAATKRGLDWLMSQQSSDGAWHSETYGAMRGGAAVTALALYAAAHAPPPLCEDAKKDLRRGLEFLLPGIDKRGCVACPDGTLDYPTYASALTLIALKRLDLPMRVTRRMPTLASVSVVRSQVQARAAARAIRHSAALERLHLALKTLQARSRCNTTPLARLRSPRCIPRLQRRVRRTASLISPNLTSVRVRLLWLGLKLNANADT